MAKNTASSQDSMKRDEGNDRMKRDQGNDRMKREQDNDRSRGDRDGGGSGTVHAHRTAKVVELVCSSTESFQDALECGLKDASATTRGITGAHVQNMSVKCRNGKIVEYKVDLKVAFGVERTPSVDSDE